jgi:hypothetical protein
VRSPRKPVDLEDRRQIGIDGVVRTVEQDEKLNTLVGDVLGIGPGVELMDYLRGLTLRTVLPVTASDQELRAMEGKRHLVFILETRLRAYRERKIPDVPATPPETSQ